MSTTKNDKCIVCPDADRCRLACRGFLTCPKEPNPSEKLLLTLRNWEKLFSLYHN